ncbi:MAG: hypothetical protein GY750_06160 [Lentisphaerae bacterium]|nr:hypothetical protein [Lentisphaerota bacterium]MCP4100992.1 hypothetical protein [Lentisphaerota bacterium]
MTLRDSKFKGNSNYNLALELCKNSQKSSRTEFRELVKKAKRISSLTQ